MVVVFTAEAKDTTYLDRIVERTLELKKQGVHAKAADDSNIPAKATAYRWPSLRWSKLEDMFA